MYLPGGKQTAEKTPWPEACPPHLDGVCAAVIQCWLSEFGARVNMISKRKIVAYGLCVVIFAGAVWYALKLSYPPDPLARSARLTGSVTRPVEVETERDVLAVGVDGETRRYRFYRTEEGLVAREVEEEE